MSPSRIGLAKARLRPLGLGGSNLLSSLSMRCQRSSGNAQSVKIVALSAIDLFVLCLINQENLDVGSYARARRPRQTLLSAGSPRRACIAGIGNHRKAYLGRYRGGMG